jgi:hypothetical protein
LGLAATPAAAVSPTASAAGLSFAVHIFNPSRYESPYAKNIIIRGQKQNTK